MKVLIPLAEGFEETEAITVIDILRRAGIDTVTAALKKNPVTGSHKISVVADKLLDENEEFNAIVLPGGMPGSSNLRDDNRIIKIIKKINASGGLTAALCAAPIVLSKAEVLKGKKYICYPGFEDEIADGIFTDKDVVVDGNIITGKGAGHAVLFALSIVAHLKGEVAAKKVSNQLTLD
ncbi:MAG: DJ-1/PfpI family protein [Spirochaetes bacterium]|nr:DJ-1/PfpI family protein [Spirochaetota bacterium]